MAQDDPAVDLEKVFVRILSNQNHLCRHDHHDHHQWHLGIVALNKERLHCMRKEYHKLGHLQTGQVSAEVRID